MVFLKFSIESAEFSAVEAARWCVRATPDQCDFEDGAESRNGLTRTAAKLHLYFLQLETEGWLKGVLFSTQKTRTFKPNFATVEQFRLAVEGNDGGLAAA